MRIGLSRHFTRATLVALMLVVGPGVARADGTGTYYDRSFVLAAHEKCRLFQAPVARALGAATLQARGAALRSGTPETTIRATADRARSRARQVACADPELAIVRDRVADAFAGWQRIPRMEFIGERGTWTADRVRREASAWRLAQPSVTGGSPVRFGISANAEGEETLSAVVSFVGRPRPYAARLVMRDPALASRPWLTAAGSAVLPPVSVRQQVFSERTTPAATTLLATGHKQGEAWIFPATAGDRLARLDPREPFVLEFLFRDGSVASAVFEAGDFAAARAFVAMGPV